MAKTAEYSCENEMGCGFMGSFFQMKSIRPRNGAIFQTPQTSKKQQLISSSNSTKSKTPQSQKPPKNSIKTRPSNHMDQRQTDATRSSTSSSSNNSNKASQVAISAYNTRRLTKEPTFTSSELSLTFSHQKHDENGALYRASTGNVMLLGHLGNLKKKEVKSGQNNAKSAVIKRSLDKTSYQLGNIFNNSTNKLDPEAIKSLGNEKYKQGKYEDALVLYDQAIALDPSKACYYSNKSAALMGSGRLIEAVIQCKEAIRLDSSYHNAHFRLAKLYLRLGVAEKSVYHYKCSGRKAGPDDIARAQSLETCLDRCNEYHNNGEWRNLLNESQTAISLGADSAPQMYVMKAEALMKLHRHQEAYNVIQNEPIYNIDQYVSLLGSSITADLLQLRALVYMANGRFEDAVTAIQHALQLDSNSNGVKLNAEKIKTVALARSNGNRFFKGLRFLEALTAYNEGLEIDTYNSVLLCNRAACRYKLGQFEKAVEDCAMALFLRPSYTKARLRRANCNAKLEKWESAIEDYELLMQEIPGDEELRMALLEAKMQLNTLHNSQIK